jgi:hypothetical protein
MRTLSIQEAEALCRWAIANRGTNWGSWTNYPVDGCSYLQFDDNPVVIKFDESVEFGEKIFRRIGWSRRIPGKDNCTTFSWIMWELKKAGINFGTYPEKRVTQEIEGKMVHYLIRQNPHADYPLPDVCIVDDAGQITRSGITTASKVYPWGLV